MENQKKDQLVYEIDLNAPTIFSMVNEAKVNPEKANAAISLDYIGNAGDGGAWTMRLEQGDKLGKMLFEIAKRHGLELEEEAEYGNRKYLEKQDFILAKQKKQLAAQQNKLDKLTLKVNDMEALIDEVSAAAYDKAVEVVTDVVRTETRKEDMRMIEDTKKWVLSPERKAPQTTREYAAHRLDTVLDKFLKTMQTTATRLQEKLLKPEVRQKGKEQVKEKARDSVLQLLSRLQAEQMQRKPGDIPAAEKSENRFQ